MATDQDIARAQWAAQRTLIKAAERRIGKAIGAAYMAGADRWQASGSVSIPIDAQRDLAANLSRMWGDAVRLGGRLPADTDKAAFMHLERKADGDLSLFDQIVLDFIQRFGALKVRAILETTRDQLQRLIDRGVREGLGQEGIAALIIDRIPSLSRMRARVIARTEVHSAAMYASQEVVRQSVFPMNKRWVSVYDHRTRDFGEGDGVVDQANHRVMNEVTVGPDELFAVPNSMGGHDMMVGPGDPSAPGYQTISCRCSLIYRRVGRPWPKSSDN